MGTDGIHLAQRRRQGPLSAPLLPLSAKHRRTAVRETSTNELQKGRGFGKGVPVQMIAPFLESGQHEPLRYTMHAGGTKTVEALTTVRIEPRARGVRDLTARSLAVAAVAMPCTRAWAASWETVTGDHGGCALASAGCRGAFAGTCAAMMGAARRKMGWQRGCRNSAEAMALRCSAVVRYGTEVLGRGEV